MIENKGPSGCDAGPSKVTKKYLPANVSAKLAQTQQKPSKATWQRPRPPGHVRCAGEAEPDRNPNSRPPDESPLIFSAWSWLQATAALIARKAYEVIREAAP